MSTIGEAARRSGVHVETIRYYERSGVVPRPARTAATMPRPISGGWVSSGAAATWAFP